MGPTKPWYKSRTIWSNAIVFVLALLPVIGAQLDVIVGTERALAIASVLGILNTVLQTVLRVFFTTTPISNIAGTTV